MEIGKSHKVHQHPPCLTQALPLAAVATVAGVEILSTCEYDVGTSSYSGSHITCAQWVVSSPLVFKPLSNILPSSVEGAQGIHLPCLLRAMIVNSVHLNSWCCESSPLRRDLLAFVNDRRKSSDNVTFDVNSNFFLTLVKTKEISRASIWAVLSCPRMIKS